MKIIKRNGAEENFDPMKIRNAVLGANGNVERESDRLDPEQIAEIVLDVERKCREMNRAVAVEEIVYGDNDSLSAVVATLIHADKLVILTETDGLYTADPTVDPKAYRIAEVPEITDEILACASSHGTKLGTGGMMTKVHAAQIATAAGIDTYVICGRDTHNIYRLMDGERVGTHFCARRNG